jgi:hypothetical protein
MHLRYTYVVDLPGSDVIVLSQSDVQKTLIIPEVEIHLSEHRRRSEHAVNPNEAVRKHTMSIGRNRRKERENSVFLVT